MQKILNPSCLFIPLISIKNKKMKSFTYSATLPLNKTRNLPPSHLFHLPNVTLLPPFQFSQPHYPPTFPFSQLHYPPTFPRFPTLPSSNLSHLLNLTTSHIQLKHSKITSLGLLSPHIVF